MSIEKMSDRNTAILGKLIYYVFLVVIVYAVSGTTITSVIRKSNNDVILLLNEIIFCYFPPEIATSIVAGAILYSFSYKIGSHIFNTGLQTVIGREEYYSRNKVITAIFGRLFYFFEKKKVEKTKNNFKISHNFVVPNLEYASLHKESNAKLESFIGSQFIAVVGPPGAGKSTLISTHMDKILLQYDLAFSIESTQFSEVDENKLNEKLLISLLKNIFGGQIIENKHQYLRKNFSLFTLSYVLRSKKIAIFIDDCHLCTKTISKITKDLAYFLQKTYKWHKNIHIIISSRTIEDGNENYKIVEINPLSQIAAVDLFYNFCTKAKPQKIEPQALVESRRIIGESFSTEQLRVPLFIAISAWLCLPFHSQPLSVDRVLGLSSGRLFEEFLRKLYENSPLNLGTKASPDSSKLFEKLLRVMEEISYLYWPRWSGFPKSRIINEIKKSLIDNFDETYRIDENMIADCGFLIEEKLGDSYRFPHQSFADYYSLRKMYNSSDFSRLSLYNNENRLYNISEMIFEFLEDEIEDKTRTSIVERISYDQPLLLVSPSISNSSMWMGVNLDSKRMGTNLARWAAEGCPFDMTVEQWRKISFSFVRQQFNELQSEALFGSIFEEAKEHGPSSQLVIASLGVSSNDAKETALSTMAKSSWRTAWVAAAHDEKVRAFLIEQMDPRQNFSDSTLHAMAVFWRYRNKSPKETSLLNKIIEDTLVNNISIDNNKIFSIIKEINSEKILAIIGRNIKSKPLKKKKYIAKLIGRETAKIMIPPGNYKTERQGDCTLEYTILIDCVPKKIGKNYQDIRMSTSKLGQDIESVINEIELDIAMEHFSSIQGDPRSGVTFSLDQEDWEVFLDTDSHFQFFRVRSPVSVSHHSPQSSTALAIRQTPSVRQPTPGNVLKRNVARIPV